MSRAKSAPTELEVAKVRLLYRIPVPPARARALELSVGGESPFLDSNWAGGRVLGHAEEFDFDDGSFDVVVLHRTLDDLTVLARRQGRVFAVAEFLSRVAAVLAGGGLVIGCVENRHALERVLRGLKRLAGRGADPGADRMPAHPLSVSACHRALASAGFGEIRLFSMLPGSELPSRLLGIEPGWSRRVCKRQLEVLRPPLVSPSSYIVWRMLAELGISQYLGPATFFWGRKAC